MANTPSRSRRWPRRLAWTALALAILLVAGIVGGRAAIAAYLRSEGFRGFLAERAGRSLHAAVEVAPLSFTGLNVYGDGFHARGESGAKFRDLRVEGVRAELSLRRFFEQVWQVESLHAERVQLSLEAPPAAAPRAPKTEAATPSASAGRSGWLPNRVEITRADVSDLQLRWAGGSVSGVAAELSPQEGGWRILGAGGRLEQRGQPPLEVQGLRLLYRAPALFVQSAELRQPGGGAIRVTGDVRLDEALQLRAEFDALALDPLLGDDWRMKLKGKAAGEVEIRSPLPTRGPPELRGTVRVIDGDLTALPVLDQIALFTRTQQFRRLKLTRASADFEHNGSRLEVRNVIAESARLIRIEGRFSIERDLIDGTFQVGVTAGSLQWLPGSQERVFTEARDGYLWTPMRLTGPVNKPQDDLTPRLAAAAGEAILDTAQGTVKDAIKSGRDVIKGALDLLLPPAK
jgi:hypothetical protein